jgi:hypothetical protein
MESVGHVGYKYDLCVILLSSVNIIGFVKLEKFCKKKKTLSEMHVIDIMILLTSHFWNNIFYLNLVTYKKQPLFHFY